MNIHSVSPSPPWRLISHMNKNIINLHNGSETLETSAFKWKRRKAYINRCSNGNHDPLVMKSKYDKNRLRLISDILFQDDLNVYFVINFFLYLPWQRSERFKMNIQNLLWFNFKALKYKRRSFSLLRRIFQLNY